MVVRKVIQTFHPQVYNARSGLMDSRAVHIILEDCGYSLLLPSDYPILSGMVFMEELSSTYSQCG